MAALLGSHPHAPEPPPPMTIPPPQPPQPPPPPAHPRMAWHHEDQSGRGGDGDTVMMDQSGASSSGHPMETEGEMAAAPPAAAAAAEEEDLPIMKHRQMIVDHIEHNPVTCVQGETGCGKSTRVPQFLLQHHQAMKSTSNLNIMCTQPRRLACIALARRVASELGEDLGQTVGYRISGDSMVSGRTKLTFVTTGYLLQVLVNDPSYLRSYSHIILDEVHERDLDADLLSLVIKLQMHAHPHMRLVIMSATLQGELFASYFAVNNMTPNTIFVGAKRFPVQTIYLNQLTNIPSSTHPSHHHGQPHPPLQPKDFPPLDPHMAAAHGGGAHAHQQHELLLANGTVVENLLARKLGPGRTQLRLTSNSKGVLTQTTREFDDAAAPDRKRGKGNQPQPQYMRNRYEQMEEDGDQDENDDDADFRKMDSLGADVTHALIDTKMQPNILKADTEELDHDESQPAGGGPSLMRDHSSPLPLLHQQQHAMAHHHHHRPRYKYRLFVLHSLIDKEEQEAVFSPPPNDTVHVVLASNIAESSLTLPAVRVVIDFCLHRRLVHDKRRHMSALLRSWTSHASSQQRAGRTGRVFPGVAIRLVSDKFYHNCMSKFDPPEMEVAPLEKLYLQVKHLAVKLNAAQKQFSTPKELLRMTVQPPPMDALDAALTTLDELGALTNNHRNEDAGITPLGALMMTLPLDIHLCRLVLFGFIFGCPCDGIVVAAAVSAQDPFTMPSHLVIKNPAEFGASLQKSLLSRAHFDANHHSEPLMLRNVFVEWLLRLEEHLLHKHRNQPNWQRQNGYRPPRGGGRGGGMRNVTQQVRSTSRVMKREYIQVSREFGRDHAVIPKRLTQLALTTLDILQRVDKLIPDVEGCPLKRSVGILLDLLQGLPPCPNVSIAELFPSIKEKNEYARHPDHDYSVGALFTRDMRLFRLLIFASFTPQFIVGSPKVYAPDGMGMDGSADWQMNANDKNTKAVAKQAKILQDMHARGMGNMIDRTVVLSMIPRDLSLPELETSLRLMCPNLRLSLQTLESQVLVTFPACSANDFMSPFGPPNPPPGPFGANSRGGGYPPIPAMMPSPPPLPSPSSSFYSQPANNEREMVGYEPRDDRQQQQQPIGEDDNLRNARGLLRGMPKPPLGGHIVKGDGVIASLDLAAHLLNQFGMGRWKFTIPLPLDEPVASFKQDRMQLDTNEDRYIDFYRRKLEITKPAHPYALGWDIVAGTAVYNFDGVNMRPSATSSGAQKQKKKAIKGCCNFRNPIGFAAACPPDNNTAKQPKEVFGVFVAQQGTDSPGLTWIEGVTLVPPHEFFTSLLAFSRHHYDIHLMCEFTLHKGTVLKGMRLYDNLREWSFPPWDDGPILTLTDLLRINHVRRLISDAFGPVSVHQEQPQHSASALGPREREETEVAVLTSMAENATRVQEALNVMLDYLHSPECDEQDYSWMADVGPPRPDSYDGLGRELIRLGEDREQQSQRQGGGKKGKKKGGGGGQANQLGAPQLLDVFAFDTAPPEPADGVKMWEFFRPLALRQMGNCQMDQRARELNAIRSQMAKQRERELQVERQRQKAENKRITEQQQAAALARKQQQQHHARGGRGGKHFRGGRGGAGGGGMHPYHQTHHGHHHGHHQIPTHHGHMPRPHVIPPPAPAQPPSAPPGSFYDSFSTASYPPAPPAPAAHPYHGYGGRFPQPTQPRAPQPSHTQPPPPPVPAQPSAPAPGPAPAAAMPPPPMNVNMSMNVNGQNQYGYGGQSQLYQQHQQHQAPQQHHNAAAFAHGQYMQHQQHQNQGGGYPGWQQQQQGYYRE
ncbi:unnamed protein product [Vitrella brassicaformis CCMP3155]|uniref:Helicase ATP-binding domain-containing protein n=3 Tax=Vitrella brassicaformis TaxID=1169539 RepID=A0A0G4GDK3_VITBC|nr:unnamed protein product [Vitrella brassicaformis CCMP3155]|eukprot:CEM27081.1 unnamed protein product [Vitrella brassicaformis CCMP3155]